ncbi:hypothetical protein TNCV_2749331 [Trichonephila clavipes]|nr:hypothetical protein TNCV_2749331 [Trichonephila clavipes]
MLYFNFLSLLRNYYSKEFYYEYDVGRGFLFANQAVLKKIEAIVDFGPCVKIPLTICEENILHMLDNLTEFEEEFPAIAFALQSNRAARRILNRVQIVLERFKEKSLILKEDIIILKKILFEMTKKVAYAPRIRPVIHDISKILEESDWIRFSDASKIILVS